MNKKIYLVAILSVLLFTISVVAVAENAKKEAVPDEQNPVQPSTPVLPSNGKDQAGPELSNPAFHETTFKSSSANINIGSTPVTVFAENLVVFTGGAELIATFSAETNTGAANTLAIEVFDNGVIIPPGTVFYDQFSEEDGLQAHSFTFGKNLGVGVHRITVNASTRGGGTTFLGFRSFVTEIEELP